MDLQIKKNFISFLLSCNVLKFGKFTTKSKRKTPYFINTGNFKFGKQLNILGEFYADFIVEKNVEFSAMFGPAYKGISLVACCSNALYEKYSINKGFFFNRKETKDHGEGGNYIGYSPKENEKIIVVEDVLTAATSIKEVLPNLKKHYKIICENAFVLVDRCEKVSNSNEKASNYLKKEFNLTVNSLITIKDILKYVENNEKYSEKIKSMQNYIEKYCIL